MIKTCNAKYSTGHYCFPKLYIQIFFLFSSSPQTIMETKGLIPKLFQHLCKEHTQTILGLVYTLSLTATFCPEFPKVQLQSVAFWEWFLLTSSAVALTQTWKALLFYQPTKHCSELNSISNNHFCLYIDYKHYKVRNL